MLLALILEVPLQKSVQPTVLIPYAAVADSNLNAQDDRGYQASYRCQELEGRYPQKTVQRVLKIGRVAYKFIAMHRDNAFASQIDSRYKAAEGQQKPHANNNIREGLVKADVILLGEAFEVEVLEGAHRMADHLFLVELAGEDKGLFKAIPVGLELRRAEDLLNRFEAGAELVSARNFSQGLDTGVQGRVYGAVDVKEVPEKKEKASSDYCQGQPQRQVFVAEKGKKGYKDIDMHCLLHHLETVGKKLRHGGVPPSTIFFFKMQKKSLTCKQRWGRRELYFFDE